MGPTALAFSALEGGVALQVVAWKVSKYKGVSQPHWRLARYSGPPKYNTRMSKLRKLKSSVAASGICSGLPEKYCGKIPEIRGSIFLSREILSILRFRALGKANLPRTSGQ